MKKGEIIKVSGPLVVARNLPEVKMYDVVRVGKDGLIGEVIEIKGERVSIQVYEETSGVGPGEPVESTGEPLSVELGPGLVKSIFDGIQRPLDEIRKMHGDYVTRGINLPALDRKKQWNFKPRVKKGDKVKSGDILGEVKETSMVTHKVMVPPGIEGEVKEIGEKKARIEDSIAVISSDKDKGKKTEVSMLQKWPVRLGRLYLDKLPTQMSLVTGTRVIDTFFPLTKGGTACIPGPFGSGKTVVLHTLAKWADAEIIIYVGCGERGNEMADVLLEFPELKDPRTDEPLIERTVLIANTSNMPVAAREASIYTGVTIGEYFRDMGYNVALMADSTSRWAEALREISGRMEEMPGEEGYPAYLASRVAAFYERAGRIRCLSSDSREGSLTIIGAVSPPGGDLSDPVVQSTLRMVKVFWGLEDRLAQQRHFPAINWLNSYSLYIDNLQKFWKEEVSEEYLKLRNRSLNVLQEEDSLQEIVRLVGTEALSPKERLTLETAKSLREDFLQQHAFDPNDVFTSLNLQYRMLSIILTLYDMCLDRIEKGIAIERLLKLSVRDRIARLKYVHEKEENRFDDIEKEMKEEIEQLKGADSA